MTTTSGTAADVVQTFGYVLQGVGGVCGIASGALWWLAATKQPVPPYLGVSYVMNHPPNPDTPWRKSWDRATRRNAYAAILTGAAAVLQGVGMLLTLA